MELSIDQVAFPSRHSRSRYVATRFAEYLKGAVLDVGCFEAPLRELLPNVSYTGIDQAGRPDLRVNLERLSALPFDEGSFDCVLCIHVLEHLDNLHTVFDELIRVSRRHVIVALPNCWRSARRVIARGEGEFKHYGLPLESAPDRHKWFFSVAQANDFLQGKARALGIEVVETLVTDNPKPPPVRWLRRLMYPGMRYHNRYSSGVWVVYRVAY